MIISLCGFSGSGKDTVADHLVSKHNFTKVVYAKALKDAASAIFGWERHLLDGDTQESREFRETSDIFWSKRFGYHFTPRRALQLLGTESTRKVFHENIWIFSAEKKILECENAVISDSRFRNDIENTRRLGGFIIRVVRGREPEWYDVALRENKTDPLRHHELEDKRQLMQQLYPNVHTSEWDWIGTDFDTIITNDGTIEQLHRKVDLIIDDMKAWRD